MPYSDVCMNMCVCVFVYVCVDMYMYVDVCVCMYMYTTLLTEYQWNCLVVYLYIQLVILIGNTCYYYPSVFRYSCLANVDLHTLLFYRDAG